MQRSTDFWISLAIIATMVFVSSAGTATSSPSSTLSTTTLEGVGI